MGPGGGLPPHPGLPGGQVQSHPRVALVHHPGLANGERKRIVDAQMHGGVEPLVTQPITTHHGLDPVERAKPGIADSMVRLSAGLQDAEDLIADLVQALQAD